MVRSSSFSCSNIDRENFHLIFSFRTSASRSRSSSAANGIVFIWFDASTEPHPSTMFISGTNTVREKSSRSNGEFQCERSSISLENWSHENYKNGTNNKYPSINICLSLPLLFLLKQKRLKNVLCLPPLLPFPFRSKFQLNKHLKQWPSVPFY